MTKKVYFNKANGYYMEYDDKRDMYIQQHQVKMEKKIGRRLREDERVHHKNEKKSDNRMSNLKLTTAKQHAIAHRERWVGKNNPSYNMSQKHKESLKKAWEKRKMKYGPTGAKNPEKLKVLGRKTGGLRKSYSK